jgi:hypothetical protein
MFKDPGRGTPHPRFANGAPIWRDTRPRTFFHTQAPSVMRPLPAFPARTQWKEVPISRVFMYAPGSPNRAPVKRDAPFLESSFRYLSQFPVNGPPPQVPQGDPYKERYPSTEPSSSHPLKIHLSLRFPGKGAPSIFPNRVPMERDILSTEPLVYISMYVCQSPPQKRSLLQNGGKKKVTVRGAPRRQKAYIQWGVVWFPKGIVNDTAISTPVPCSPRHNTFHLGLGRPESC